MLFVISGFSYCWISKYNSFYLQSPWSPLSLPLHTPRHWILTGRPSSTGPKPLPSSLGPHTPPHMAHAPCFTWGLFSGRCRLSPALEFHAHCFLAQDTHVLGMAIPTNPPNFSWFSWDPFVEGKQVLPSIPTTLDMSQFLQDFLQSSCLRDSAILQLCLCQSPWVLSVEHLYG